MTKSHEAMSTAISTQKRWLNPSELETEYGFSKSWQGKARMSGSRSNLPFSKIGKFVKYDRFTIDKWLKLHQVQGEVS